MQSSADFILPYGKSFTREEIEKMMAMPGVKYVHRGPPWTMDWNFGLCIEPEDRNRFNMHVKLFDTGSPAALKLAEEVKQKLLEAKPENSGRALSFPVWKTRRIRPRRESLRLVHLGWVRNIREVKKTRDGWQASVDVVPLARTEDFRVVSIHRKHFEVYELRDGRLKLRSEQADPSDLSPEDDPVMPVSFM